jgi:hypothetical protein
MFVTVTLIAPKLDDMRKTALAAMSIQENAAKGSRISETFYSDISSQVYSINDPR